MIDPQRLEELADGPAAVIVAATELQALIRVVRAAQVYVDSYENNVGSEYRIPHAYRGLREALSAFKRE